MNSPRSSPDGLIEKFAREYRLDSGQLMIFCSKYPEFAAEFVELAHEIALQKSLCDQTLLSAEDEKWIADASAARERTATDPFAALSPKSYASIRTSLNVPGVVVNAFRDRIVALATVPMEFLEDFARELSTNVAVLARYLEGTPKTAPSASYKSDVAPAVPKIKMSFDEILRDAGVPPEKRSEILNRE
jgi:hypothetical protein